MFVIAAFVLSACGYDEKNITGGPGKFKCTSNAGRPDLTFDSSTFKASHDPLSGIGTVKFIDIATGHHYSLHTVEDRDYHCKRMTTVPKLPKPEQKNLVG